MRFTYCFAFGILFVAPLGCSKENAGQIPAAPVAHQQTAARGVPVQAAPAPGKEIEGVKKMLAELQNVKSLDQMADHFTNESAAAFGIMLMMPLAMAAAFEDMGANMAKEFGGGKATVKSTDPTGPKIKTDLEATLKKYGMSEKTDPGDQKALTGLNSRGREFLRDMAGLLEKLDKNKKPGESGFKIDKGKMPVKLDDVSFKVVSPTRVEIKNKDPKEQKVEARWEDGQWRLHLGDLKTLMEQSQMKMGAPGARAPKPKP